jgi:hypothetical protein
MARTIAEQIERPAAGTLRPEVIERFERRELTRQLAAVFDSVLR